MKYYVKKPTTSSSYILPYDNEPLRHIENDFLPWSFVPNHLKQACKELKTMYKDKEIYILNTGSHVKFLIFLNENPKDDPLKACLELNYDNNQQKFYIRSRFALKKSKRLIDVFNKSIPENPFNKQIANFTSAITGFNKILQTNNNEFALNSSNYCLRIQDEKIYNQEIPVLTLYYKNNAYAFSPYFSAKEVLPFSSFIPNNVDVSFLDVAFYNLQASNLTQETILKNITKKTYDNIAVSLLPAWYWCIKKDDSVYTTSPSFYFALGYDTLKMMLYKVTSNLIPDYNVNCNIAINDKEKDVDIILNFTCDLTDYLPGTSQDKFIKIMFSNSFVLTQKKDAVSCKNNAFANGSLTNYANNTKLTNFLKNYLLELKQWTNYLQNNTVIKDNINYLNVLLTSNVHWDNNQTNPNNEWKCVMVNSLGTELNNNSNIFSQIPLTYFDNITKQEVLIYVNIKDLLENDLSKKLTEWIEPERAYYNHLAKKDEDIRKQALNEVDEIVAQEDESSKNSIFSNLQRDNESAITNTNLNNTTAPTLELENTALEYDENNKLRMK